MARRKSADITKTGPVGLQGIRGTDLYGKMVEDSASNPDVAAILNTISRTRYTPGEVGDINRYFVPTEETNPEWKKLGQSSYDSPVVFGNDPSVIDEYRADRQGAFLQTVNGIAKGVTTAATTFVDGTAGLLWGLGQGIYNAATADYSNEDGGWNKFWHGAGELAEGLFNNDVSNSMRALNQYMEEVLPNYRTKDEIENPWALRNIFSANTIADEFLKNLGFTVGAFYSGGAYLKALKGIGNLVKAGQMSETAARTIGSVMNGLSEGRIEAGNLYDEQIKTEKGNLDAEFSNIYAELDQMPDGPEKAMAIADLNRRYQQATQDIEERASDAAIADMIGNTLYLSASEFWTFGKLYGSKYAQRTKLKDQVKNQGKKALDIVAEEAERAETIGSKVTRNAKGLYETVKKSPKKAALTGLGTGVLEGMEEMNQSFMASAFGNMYIPDSPDSYYRALTQDNYEASSRDFMTALKEGLKESWGNSDTYKEGAIGFLTGILGMPSFGRAQNSSDYTYLGKGSRVGISGGIFGEIARANSLNAQAEQNVSEMNKFVKKIKDTQDFFTRMTAFQDAMDGYSAEKNQFEYQNASDNDMFNGIDAYARTGRLEDLKEMVSEDFENMSDERLADIAHNTQSDTNEWKNGDGTYMSDTEKGRKKMREELSKRRDSILSSIDEYEKSLSDVRYISGNALTDDQTRELAWLDWKGKQFTKRYEEIKKENQPLIRKLSNTIEAFKRGRGRGMFDEKTEEGRNLAKQVENFGDLLAMINEADSSPLLLGNLLKANKPLLDILAEDSSPWAAMLEDLSGVDHNTFDRGIKQLLDAAKIGQASVQFNERFKEFTKNPTALIGNREKLEKKAEKTNEVRRNTNVLNNLDNASIPQIVSALENGELPDDIASIVAGEEPSDVNSERVRKLEEAQKIVDQVNGMEESLRRMMADPSIDQQAVADAQAMLQRAGEVADQVDQLSDMSSEAYSDPSVFMSENDYAAAAAAAQSAEEAEALASALGEQRLAAAQTILNQAAKEAEKAAKEAEKLPGSQPQGQQTSPVQSEPPVGHDSVTPTPAVNQQKQQPETPQQQPTQYEREAAEDLRATGTPIQPSELNSVTKALAEVYSLIDTMGRKQNDDPKVIASTIQALPSFAVLQHALRPETIQGLVNRRIAKAKSPEGNTQATTGATLQQGQTEDPDRIVTPAIAQGTVDLQISQESQRTLDIGQNSNPLNYWKPTTTRYPIHMTRGALTPFMKFNSETGKYEFTAPNNYTEAQIRRITTVYSFLEKRGAFDNVDNGAASISDPRNKPEIHFVSYKSVNEAAGEIVIFMVDSQGRILGDLGSKNDPGTDRQNGIIDFINTAEEEYRQKETKTSDDCVELTGDTKVLQNMVGKVPYTFNTDRRTLNVIWEGKPFQLAVARSSGSQSQMIASNRTLSDPASPLEESILPPLNAVAGQPYVLVETSDPKRKYIPVPFSMPRLNSTTAQSSLGKAIRSVFDAIPKGDWRAIKEPLMELLAVQKVSVEYSQDKTAVKQINIQKQDGSWVRLYDGSASWEGAPDKAFNTLVSQGDIPFQISRKYINGTFMGQSYNSMIGELAETNLPVGGTHTVNDWFTVSPIGKKGSYAPTLGKNPNSNRGQERPTGQSINYKGVNYIVTPEDWKAYKENGEEVAGELAMHIVARVQVVYNSNDINSHGPFQTTKGWYDPVSDKFVNAPTQESEKTSLHTDFSTQKPEVKSGETTATPQSTEEDLLNKVRDSLDTAEKEEMWNQLSTEQKQQLADLSSQGRDQFFEEVEDIFEDGKFTEDVSQFLPGGSRYSKVKERPKSRKWNEAKERAWLERALPQLSTKDRLRIHRGLINISKTKNPQYAYGMFRRGIITIASNAANGTLYHEAFHSVTWTLLSDEERTKLFDNAQEIYGLSSALALEERMAEDFRKYVQSERRPLIGKLVRTFRTLKHLVTSLFGKEPYLDKVFYNINRGKYADRTQSISDETRYDINSREREEIKQKAVENGTFMLAPNGKPTNLTEDQWITVRTKAFKEWFGDWENTPENASKVVDENGEPKAVMHGSPEKDIRIFDASRGKQKAAGSLLSEESSKMNFFTDDEVTANAYMEDFNGGKPIYGKIYDVFLNIKNPKVIDYKGGNWDGEAYEAEYYDPLLAQWIPLKAGENDELDYFAQESDIYKKAKQVVTWHSGAWTDEDIRFKKVDSIKSTNEEAELALEEGSFDGVIIKNVAEVGQGSFYGSITANDYVTFNTPSQIKSATDNIGTFDSNNPDIRYRTVEEYNEETREAEETVKELEDVVNNSGKFFSRESHAAYSAVPKRGWSSQTIKGDRRRFGKVDVTGYSSESEAKRHVPSNMSHVVYITESYGKYYITYNKERARELWSDYMYTVREQLRGARQRLARLKAEDFDTLLSNQALESQEEYQAKIEQYYRDKLEFGNLTPEQKEYLDERDITPEEYNQMTQAEKSTLLKCMI